jgi:hypothetical protein
LSTFAWPEQRHTAGYEVARGVSVRFKTDCVIFETSAARITDTSKPLRGSALYYLVRASLPLGGSWGRNSGGKERFPVCH